MENATENKQKFDYTTLSLPKQQLWLTCRRIMKALKDGSCTDEEVRQVMAMGDAKAHGFVNPNDYLSVEQAMQLLRVHRVKFFQLLHLYNVKPHVINGKSMGYYRGDIDCISAKLIEDMKK